MSHETPTPDPLEARGPASPTHTGADHAEAAAAGSLSNSTLTHEIDPTLARRAIRDTLGKVNQLLLRQDCYDLTPWEEGASWERVISHLLEAKSLAMRARNKVADQLAPPPAPEEDFSASLAPGLHPVRTIVAGGSVAALAAGLLGVNPNNTSERSA